MERVALADIFATARPIVGMVHLLPLPGAPRWGGSMDAVLERALADAEALVAGGVDGLLVENFLDAPFYPDTVPPETTAAMAVVVRAIVRAAAPLGVGVNVLRNDAAAALGVAAATGARFIRVNVHTGVMLADQGWLPGRAHETLRLRARLGARVAILADVLVKHATSPAPQDAGQVARDTWERGLADGLIASGTGTGAPTDRGRVIAIKQAVPAAPVWIGSGLTPENAADLLPAADGAIVGSSLARDGRAGHGIDRARVAALMKAVAAVRG